MEQPNIKPIVKALGGAGKTAILANANGIDLKRQTIESWCKAGKYPRWRTADVTHLLSFASNLPKPSKRKGAK